MHALRLSWPQGAHLVLMKESTIHQTGRPGELSIKLTHQKSCSQKLGNVQHVYIPDRRLGTSIYSTVYPVSVLPLLVLVPPNTMAGTPAAEEMTQMPTLMPLALSGVRKSSALTGWHTAT